MLTIGQEGPTLVEIDSSDNIWPVAFTANGEYLVGGGERLGVWQVEDGKQMVTMAVWGVWCLMVSKDGRWIAVGTLDSEVFVWDAETFEEVFLHKDSYHILGVDFSPDST